MSYHKKNKLVLISSLVLIITGIVFIGIQLSHTDNVLFFYRKYITIVYNSCLCLILIGAGYLLLQFDQNKKAKTFLLIIAVLLNLICLLTIAEYIFHFDAGIERLLVPGGYSNPIINPSIYAKMLPATAVVYLCLGLALLGFATKIRIVHIISQYCLHLVSVICSILLIGFAYSGPSLVTIQTHALNYVWLGCWIITLSVAASFRYPSLGITSLFSGTLVGNKMARRLFIVMAISILIFGLVKIRYLGFTIWQYDTASSLFVFFVLVAALLIIWNTANWLNKVDIRRIKAENELKVLNAELENRVEERTDELSVLLEKYKESELKFRTLVERSMVGVYISMGERFLYVNPRLAEIFGYEPQELIDMQSNLVGLLFNKESQDLIRSNIQARYSGEVDDAHYQVSGVRKDGSTAYVEIFGNIVTIAGQPSIIGTMLDVSERYTMYDELKKSEANLRSIFDTTEVNYMLLDTNYNIVAINQQSIDWQMQLTGVLFEKGVNLINALPPERRASTKALYDRVIQSNQSFDYEPSYLNDGAYTHFFANVKPIHDGKKAIGICITGIDITKRKIAEDNLQKSKANLRTILETASTGYALLDRDLNIVTFNHRAVEFVNNHLGAFPKPGESPFDFLPKDRLAEFREFANEVMQGKNISNEVNYPRADGSILYFNVSMYPIRDKQNEIVGLMLAISDITDIKRYTNAIEEQNKKLREIAWLQSHTVRAPLARMMGIINLLRNHKMDITEYDKFLVHLSTSAVELDEIIKDISDKTDEIN